MAAVEKQIKLAKRNRVIRLLVKFMIIDLIVSIIGSIVHLVVDNDISELAMTIIALPWMAVVYAIAFAFTNEIASVLIFSFFIISFLFRLTVRGMWKLITKPYMVLMMAAGIFLAYYFLPYFYDETDLFLTLGRAAVSPFVLLNELCLSSFGQTIPYINSYTFLINYVSPLIVYLFLLSVFCRIRVFLSFRHLSVITDEGVLSVLNSVVDDSKRVSRRVPSNVYFYLDPSDDFNAYAFDYNKVAINQGLLDSDIKEDEFKAIIAHEMGHIAHQDVVAMNYASANYMLLLSIILIPSMLLYYMGTSSAKDNSSSGLTAIAFLLMAAIGFLGVLSMRVVNYICYLLGGKISERGADLFAVETGHGEGLTTFFADFIDSPSGGLSDPHPSMRNRLKYTIKALKKKGNSSQELIAALEEIAIS